MAVRGRTFSGGKGSTGKIAAMLQGRVNTRSTSHLPNIHSGLPPEGFLVLIVEDNPHIVEMYSYALRKLAAGALAGKIPLEVQVAPDGHRALKLLLERRFDLVLTDLYMPVLDGFALIENIRAEPSLAQLPIVAISAGGADAREKALASGVDVYLRKPVRFAEVLETVKQLLRIP